MYHLKMTFNGETFEVDTDNIGEAILALKPEVLFTEIYLTISLGDFVRERRQTLEQGKKLFNSDEYREVFLINLAL